MFSPCPVLQSNERATTREADQSERYKDSLQDDGEHWQVSRRVRGVRAVQHRHLRHSGPLRERQHDASRQRHLRSGQNG